MDVLQTRIGEIMKISRTEEVLRTLVLMEWSISHDEIPNENEIKRRIKMKKQELNIPKHQALPKR